MHVFSPVPTLPAIRGRTCSICCSSACLRPPPVRPTSPPSSPRLKAMRPNSMSSAPTPTPACGPAGGARVAAVAGSSKMGLLPDMAPDPGRAPDPPGPAAVCANLLLLLLAGPACRPPSAPPCPSAVACCGSPVHNDNNDGSRSQTQWQLCATAHLATPLSTRPTTPPS